jgi:hypothetical protein
MFGSPVTNNRYYHLNFMVTVVAFIGKIGQNGPALIVANDGAVYARESIVSGSLHMDHGLHTCKSR